MDLSSEKNKYQQNFSHKNLDINKQKFENFDFLRAIFSISIVAYKTNLFYVPTQLFSNRLTYAFSDYILSGIVGAIAVPVFLQISLFIFDIKSYKIGYSYFIKKRFSRLISLYLFWLILITLYDVLFIDKFATISENFSSFKQIILFVVSGNNTPYFFFFSLIFVTIASEALIYFLRILGTQLQTNKLTYYLLIVSCAWVFACSTLDPVIHFIGIQSSFLNAVNNLARWDYNPLNFLPYIFTAAITAQEYNDGKLQAFNKFIKQKLSCLLGLALMFFVLEWTLTSNRFLIQVDQAPLDHYMRLSLLFGSWSLLYIALLSRLKVPTVIKIVSNLSLDIYGFHVFFIYKKRLYFDEILQLKSLQNFPVLQTFSAFFITLLGSMALSFIFGKIKFTKKWVT
jgi:hypothetical protein